MSRCTIELLPGGDAARARIIGLVEIANIGGTSDVGEYAVALKKTPPFTGALKTAWRRGRLRAETDDVIGDVIGGEDEEIIASRVSDLLYRALKACGLEERIPKDASPAR
jgi:hypothetical protein